jgi:hypothetical protein
MIIFKAPDGAFFVFQTLSFWQKNPRSAEQPGLMSMKVT